MNHIEIQTPDGKAPAVFWDNQGPSVLFLIDGIGMRPAIVDVAAKIAAKGYRVVAPDLFYRLGTYEAPDPKTLFSDPELGKAWWGRVVPIMTAANVTKDLTAYLDFLNVPKVGVVGYCMGGRLAYSAAALFPDRIAAAAAYHPGGLVTDGPDSPHLVAAQVKAKVYIGAAKEDRSFDAAQIKTFDQALTHAHVDHTIEVYDAKHGWVPSDTPVHDAAATQKHYDTLFALFESTLR
ncbi:MAG: dienelactone hydrolase family protein [Kofleriaceae bacterium]